MKISKSVKVVKPPKLTVTKNENPKDNKSKKAGRGRKLAGKSKSNENEIIDEVKNITRAFMASCFNWTGGDDDLSWTASHKNVCAISYTNNGTLFLKNLYNPLSAKAEINYDQKNPQIVDCDDRGDYSNHSFDETLVIYRIDKISFNEDFISEFQVHLDEIKNELNNLADEYLKKAKVRERKYDGKPVERPIAPSHLDQFTLVLNPHYIDPNERDKSKEKKVMMGAVGYYVRCGTNSGRWNTINDDENW